MKNKDVEDIALEALDYLYPKKNDYVENLVKMTKEAFAAHRVHDFQILRIKNLEKALENKDVEIQQHQKAIDNLRGYMGFLESQIEQYKRRLDEHEDSY